MALTQYKQKRDFKETPEPTGGNPAANKLRFVIQKHDATRLHYDFRLEVEGVLKSWAVPKGPSTNPQVKRLAMMVEDHPYDYRTFEGIIPSGYGAGTVIVWDEGFYYPVDSEGKDKKTQDKELLKGIKSGKLHIVLQGIKLKGEYALIHTKGKGENTWLLFKIKDKFASADEITLKDKSVLSNKTLTQIQKTANDSSKNGKQVVAIKKGKDPKKVNQKVKRIRKLTKTISKGTRAKMPSQVLPMLATLVDKPFDKEGWQFEIKWDGYRTIAICSNQSVELKSRNDKSFNEKFYPILNAVQEWDINAVIDGEIVVLDKTGKANFASLQNWRSEADGELFFYVFDLLWLNGKDLMQVPLSERRTLLRDIVPTEGLIRMSENFGNNGLEVFEAAKNIGLEGIIAKKSDSAYTPGERSNLWLKIKANKRQEMVIGGYTKNDGSSKAFSSLLVGVFEKGELVYTGKVGTGFNSKQQTEMLKEFKPLISKSSPFRELPDINKPSRFRHDPPNASVIWMKPTLVCEVDFAEMTTDGVMRHPSFVAMRMDKNAKDVGKDDAAITATLTSRSNENDPKILKPTVDHGRKTFLNPSDETQVRNVDGHDLKFTNLSKFYWTKEKITKRDLLNYYYQVAPFIIPYLKDRPQSMNRYPNGIEGKSFYFKDVSKTAPPWMETFDYRSDADNRLRKYLVAQNDASLLYMTNLGCIEMNPWSSRVNSPDHPDWCIIDLDPGKNSFEQVIEAAQVTYGILENMGVASYPKTSGSTGIHIYIPLGAKYTYEQSKEFARIIATLVHRELPRFTSIERIVQARKGKMYIDFLQNRPQATVASAYSVRPKPGATVSMPLHWTEVKVGLKMKDFTINNAIARIKKEGDIFKPVLGKGIELEKIVENFRRK
ncbi:MAG TPA: DNA ligase D [Chryseolinea sp.]|nr:DNA ligase D [Chryseolinea sp.]